MPLRSAILLGGAMAQVGEFSFIIASDAFVLELIDVEVYNLILGTAVVSILLTPLATQISERLAGPSNGDGPAHARGGSRPGMRPMSRTEGQLEPADDEVRPSIVVLGSGRVGRVVVRAVRNRGFRCVVIDRDPRKLEDVAKTGAVTMFGDARTHTSNGRGGLGAC